MTLRYSNDFTDKWLRDVWKKTKENLNFEIWVQITVLTGILNLAVLFPTQPDGEVILKICKKNKNYTKSIQYLKNQLGSNFTRYN